MESGQLYRPLPPISPKRTPVKYEKPKPRKRKRTLQDFMDDIDRAELEHALQPKKKSKLSRQEKKKIKQEKEKAKEEKDAKEKKRKDLWKQSKENRKRFWSELAKLNPNLKQGFSKRDQDEVCIFNADVSVIPDSVGLLHSARGLRICGNQELRDLPAAVGNLDLLFRLFVCENRLSSIPKSIGNMHSLKELHLHRNELTCLPDAVGGLENLQVLSLHNNKLRELPPSISNLKNLKILWVRFNCLTALPANIGNLTSLVLLSLEDNLLKSVPASLGSLRNLQKLYLQNNQLAALPLLLDLVNLEELRLENNKLPLIPEYLRYLPKMQVFNDCRNPVGYSIQDVEKLRMQNAELHRELAELRGEARKESHIISKIQDIIQTHRESKMRKMGTLEGHEPVAPQENHPRVPHPSQSFTQLPAVSILINPLQHRAQHQEVEERLVKEEDVFQDVWFLEFRSNLERQAYHAVSAMGEQPNEFANLQSHWLFPYREQDPRIHIYPVLENLYMEMTNKRDQLVLLRTLERWIAVNHRFRGHKPWIKSRDAESEKEMCVNRKSGVKIEEYELALQRTLNPGVYVG